MSTLIRPQRVYSCQLMTTGKKPVAFTVQLQTDTCPGTPIMSDVQKLAEHAATVGANAWTATDTDLPGGKQK